jgi:activator of HSP90 ATPase
MKNGFEISVVFPASPEMLYTAWLSSKGHSAITGAKAEIRPITGEKFTAWDDYISGENVELENFRRIVQKWRTTDFPADSPDSRLEILFEETKGGTQITLIHTGLPEGTEDEYLKGWKDYYFKPMKKFLAKRGKEKWEKAFKIIGE